MTSKAQRSVILTFLLLASASVLPASASGSVILVAAGSTLELDHALDAQELRVHGTLRVVAAGDVPIRVERLVVATGGSILGLDGAAGRSSEGPVARGGDGADGGNVLLRVGDLVVEAGGAIVAGSGGAGGRALGASEAYGGQGGAAGSVLVEATSVRIDGGLLPGRAGDGGSARVESVGVLASVFRAVGGDGGSGGDVLVNGVSRIPAGTPASAILAALPSSTATAAECDPTGIGAPGASNPSGVGGDGGDACMIVTGATGTAGVNGESGFWGCTDGGKGGKGGPISASAAGGAGGFGRDGGGAGGSATAQATGGTGGTGGKGGKGFFDDCNGGDGGDGGEGVSADAVGGKGGDSSCGPGGGGGGATAHTAGGAGGAGGSGESSGSPGAPGTAGPSAAVQGQGGTGHLGGPTCDLPPLPLPKGLSGVLSFLGDLGECAGVPATIGLAGPEDSSSITYSQAFLPQPTSESSFCSTGVAGLSDAFSTDAQDEPCGGAADSWGDANYRIVQHYQRDCVTGVERYLDIQMWTAPGGVNFEMFVTFYDGFSFQQEYATGVLTRIA